MVRQANPTPCCAPCCLLRAPLLLCSCAPGSSSQVLEAVGRLLRAGRPGSSRGALSRLAAWRLPQQKLGQQRVGMSPRPPTNKPPSPRARLRVRFEHAVRLGQPGLPKAAFQPSAAVARLLHGFEATRESTFDRSPSHDVAALSQSPAVLCFRSAPPSVKARLRHSTSLGGGGVQSRLRVSLVQRLLMFVGRAPRACYPAAWARKRRKRGGGRGREAGEAIVADLARLYFGLLSRGRRFLNQKSRRRSFSGPPAFFRRHSTVLFALPRPDDASARARVRGPGCRKTAAQGRFPVLETAGQRAGASQSPSFTWPLHRLACERAPAVLRNGGRFHSSSPRAFTRAIPPVSNTADSGPLSGRSQTPRKHSSYKRPPPRRSPAALRLSNRARLCTSIHPSGQRLWRAILRHHQPQMQSLGPTVQLRPYETRYKRPVYAFTPLRPAARGVARDGVPLRRPRSITSALDV